MTSQAHKHTVLSLRGSQGLYILDQPQPLPELVTDCCVNVRWLPRSPCDRCVDCVWCCSEVACLPQDPDGSYIARWVPELARLPKKYLHMPWKAAEDTLRAAGVSFGSSEGQYPHRITAEVMQVIILSLQCCCKVSNVSAGLCGLALCVPCMQVLQLGCKIYGCRNFMFCTY